MKIATIIVRVLLGLLYVMSSIVVLFNLVKAPEPTGAVKTFMDGMMATKYLLPFIKITELVCGLLLLSGRFVPLATVMIFPVTLNIFFFHIFVAPEGVVTGVIVLAMNLFLAYACRKNYQTLLAAKIAT
jgi:putative oxidoreductase